MDCELTEERASVVSAIHIEDDDDGFSPSLAKSAMALRLMKAAKVLEQAR